MTSGFLFENIWIISHKDCVTSNSLSIWFIYCNINNGYVCVWENLGNPTPERVTINSLSLWFIYYNKNDAYVFVCEHMGNPTQKRVIMNILSIRCYIKRTIQQTIQKWAWYTYTWAASGNYGCDYISEKWGYNENIDACDNTNG